MKLVEFLQGKWLGHPLHPAIVHVPVGAWLTAGVLDVIAWAGGVNAVLAQVAVWCVGLGLVGALLAVAPGVVDWSSVKKEKPAWKLGLYHMLLNLLATLLWALNFGLRLTAEDAGARVGTAVLATSIAGIALVVAGAYLGSLMVFDHGIGVARESKKEWRQIAIRGGARVPEE